MSDLRIFRSTPFMLGSAIVAVAAAAPLWYFGSFSIRAFDALDFSNKFEGAGARFGLHALAAAALYSLFCLAWILSCKMILSARVAMGKRDAMPLYCGIALLAAIAGICGSALTIGRAFAEVARGEAVKADYYHERIAEAYLPSQFGHLALLLAALIHLAAAVQLRAATAEQPKRLFNRGTAIAHLVALILIVASGYNAWRNAAAVQESLGLAPELTRPAELARHLVVILQSVLATCIGLVVLAVVQFATFFVKPRR